MKRIDVNVAADMERGKDAIIEQLRGELADALEVLAKRDAELAECRAQQQRIPVAVLAVAGLCQHGNPIKEFCAECGA